MYIHTDPPIAPSEQDRHSTPGMPHVNAAPSLAEDSYSAETEMMTSWDLMRLRNESERRVDCRGDFEPGGTSLTRFLVPMDELPEVELQETAPPPQRLVQPQEEPVEPSRRSSDDSWAVTGEWSILAGVVCGLAVWWLLS